MNRHRGFRLLARLHARGFHTAVLAAIVVMPTVAATGYLTRGADREIDGLPSSAPRAKLRPSLRDEDAPPAR